MSLEAQYIFTIKLQIPGICLMYLKEFEDAKNEITRALSCHKNDQSFITLGKIHLLQGDLNRAVDVYKQGVL